MKDTGSIPMDGEADNIEPGEGDLTHVEEPILPTLNFEDLLEIGVQGRPDV